MGQENSTSDQGNPHAPCPLPLAPHLIDENMSSQRYQEFIAERTRLLERIKELENENAELRKRPGNLLLSHARK